VRGVVGRAGHRISPHGGRKVTVVPPPPPPPPTSPAPPPSTSPAPPPPTPASITVSRVSKWFGDVVAVSDVSFEVRAGVTALLGPNGAGKSTMLRMLCGLTTPAQGQVRVLDSDPRADTAIRRQIGLVPQQESLFSHQRAVEFVTLAARLHGLDDRRWSMIRTSCCSTSPSPGSTRANGWR